MIHPLFANILQTQLGVKMCDEDRHDDVDYDYPEEEEYEDPTDFEYQRSEFMGRVL